MSDNIPIAKDPQLPKAQDYNAMRLLGQQYIQQLGSSIWTDYNIHDPGITILEALCYAITDLTYRASFEMQDLLAVPPQQTPDPDLQALFTAKTILTVNPWTEADYRKLLIDTTGVKNAWLSCRCCPCDDLFLYANCKT